MARKGIYRHNVVITGSDDAAKQVSLNAWNDDKDKTGMMGFAPTTSTITISSGLLLVTDTWTVVAAETGTADVLTNITVTNTATEDIIMLVADAGDTITVTSGAGGSGQINTLSGNTETLTENTPMVLIRRGTIWFEFDGDASTTNPLSQFASTTSAQLGGVISDETGVGGLLVFNSSPVLTTPTIADFTNATHDHTNNAGGGILLSTSALSDTADIAYLNTANIFIAGNKQTISQSATIAGLNLGTVSAAPSSLVEGDVWYQGSNDSLAFRDVSATRILVTLDNTQTLTNKSFSLTNNTFTGTSAELATAISDETGSGLVVFNSSPVIVTPTIASFTNATHDHSNAAGGGNLTNSALTSGVFSAITGLGTQTQTLNMGTNNINDVNLIRVADGTPTAPAYSFQADTGMGWNRSGGSMVYSDDGSQRFAFVAGDTFKAILGGAMLNEAPTATNPNWIPISTVLGTGIGGLTGTISLITGDVERINVATTGDVTLTNNLDVEGHMALGLQASLNADTNLTIDRDFTATGSEAVEIEMGQGNITLATSGSYRGLRYRSAGQIITVAGIHPLITSFSFATPNINNASGATITEASTVQIVNAPTLGDLNFALHVKAGISRFDGLILADIGSAGAPSITFNGREDVGIFSIAANNLSFATSGSERFRLNAGAIFGLSVGAASILNTTPSTTIPTILPRRESTGMGMGSGGTDQLSLITGGTERINISSTGDVTLTNELDVEGFSAFGNGSALNLNTTILIDRDFIVSGAANGRQLRVKGDITANTNNDIDYVDIAPEGEIPIGTSNRFDGVRINTPIITATGTLLESVTLRIVGASTAATTNYALFVDAGNSRFDGQILAQDGTSSLPAYAFNSTAGYGMYLDVDILKFTTNATERLWIESDGDIVMPNGSQEFSGFGSSSGMLRNANASNTIVTIHPRRSNTLTGMGGNANEISLIINSVEAIRIDASQRTAVGSAVGEVANAAQFSILSESGTTAFIINHAAAGAGGQLMLFRKSRGTLSAPTAISNGDTSGFLAFQARGDSANNAVGQILVRTSITAGLAHGLDIQLQLNDSTGSLKTPLTLTPTKATFAAQVLTQDGTVTNPAIAFSSDPNTGTFSVGTDVYGIAVGGIAALQLKELNSQAFPIWHTTAGILAASTQTQAAATLLGSAINEVATVGTAGDGVKLPIAEAGLDITVINNGANDVDIYPNTSDQINALSVDAAFTLSAGSRVIFKTYNATNWVTF